jgi:hypothetical protein
MKRALTIVLAAYAVSAEAGPAHGQSGPSNRCNDPLANGISCYAVVQALASAVPQVGMAAAGGNPLPGTASVAGVRLGFLPRVTAGLRFTAVRMRLPDVNDRNFDVGGHESSDLVPTLNADVAVSAYSGMMRGAAAGIGAIDLLLSAGVFPGAGGIEGTAFAYGGGVRLGIVRETFGIPAVNVSAMVRRVGDVQIGRACPATGLPCPDRGAGQLDFGVNDVSVRGTVGKRVGRVGLVGGVGYDRFTGSDERVTYSTTDFGFTQAEDVSEGRWSAFADLSIPLKVGAVTFEGGWMNGGDPVPGFDAQSAYDPGSGTIFGSVALRLSL